MSTLNVNKWKYELKGIEGYAEKPSFTKSQFLASGDFLLGASFSRPLCVRVSPGKSAEAEPSYEEINLEGSIGDDALAVVGGFHASRGNDVDMSVLHPSGMSGWMKKLFGKDFSQKTGEDLALFLDEKGDSLSSSHLQWKNGKFEVRRVKDAGLAWDVWFLGDYVFGITPTHMWRERYLHMQLEKRETLRSDLLGNFQIHRDGNGSFFALTHSGRLCRFEYTESKAKPTPKRLPGMDKNHGFEFSVISETDKWLYGVSGAGTELFRLRRNPVSFEEEVQNLWTSERPISALASVDVEGSSKVVATVEDEAGAQVYALKTEVAEDAELVPDAPEIQSLGRVEGCSRVSTLTWDFNQRDKAVVWGAEGYFGSAMTAPESNERHIIRFELQ